MWKRRCPVPPARRRGGGAVKACSRDRFPLAKAQRLIERLPLPAAMPGQGDLSRLLQEEDRREDAREHGLHVEL